MPGKEREKAIHSREKGLAEGLKSWRSTVHLRAQPRSVCRGVDSRKEGMAGVYGDVQRVGPVPKAQVPP